MMPGYRLRPIFFAVAAVLAATATFALAQDKPKFGPDAVPVTVDNAYLKKADAPDYWAMAPFYLPQQTSSACSLASVAVAVNTLRGLPPKSDDKLVTQNGLLETVGLDKWRDQAKEEGEGVTFADFETVTQSAFKSYNIGYSYASAQPGKNEAATLERFREVLKANEASANDVVMVYFNQGVVTGDWDGPHISPIGAYDEQKDRVLVMDVDREWYVPYWTQVGTLYMAMRKPAPADQGVLAGETGGWVHVTRTN